MENTKYGKRREGRWSPIRAKAQDTIANPNSWETHLVRQRWDIARHIGLLGALSLRIMMMMIYIKFVAFKTFIHSCYFYSASSSPLLLRGQRRLRHSTDTVSEFHPEDPQATASEGLAKGPFVAARAGVEPATLQTVGVKSTTELPLHTNKQYTLYKHTCKYILAYIYTCIVCIHMCAIEEGELPR